MARLEARRAGVFMLRHGWQHRLESRLLELVSPFPMRKSLHPQD